jgi:hypothetical protein
MGDSGQPKRYNIENILPRVTLLSTLPQQQRLFRTPHHSPYSSDYMFTTPMAPHPRSVPVRMVLGFICSLGPNNSSIDDNKGSNQVSAGIREFGPCLGAVWRFSRGGVKFVQFHSQSPTKKKIVTVRLGILTLLGQVFNQGTIICCS